MLLVKTDLGHRVMKDRSVALTPRQRSAFILFDGKRTLDQVLAATGAAGVTRADVDKLFEFGLLGQAAAAAAESSAAQPAASVEAQDLSPTESQHKQRTPQERYAEAYPIATRLTAGLGLMGFRLNLAVEGASTYDDLMRIAPKILAAVGPEKYRPLEYALNDR